jgi:hypothetical protein
VDLFDLATHLRSSAAVMVLVFLSALKSLIASSYAEWLSLPSHFGEGSRRDIAVVLAPWVLWG